MLLQAVSPSERPTSNVQRRILNKKETGRISNSQEIFPKDFTLARIQRHHSQ
jgi:hypothetical protein